MVWLSLSIKFRMIVQRTCLRFYCFSPLQLSPPFLQRPIQMNIKNTARHLRTRCVWTSIFTCLDIFWIFWRRIFSFRYETVSIHFSGYLKRPLLCLKWYFITANPGRHRQQPANLFTQLCQNVYTKTRTGRSAASFVYTSVNITLAQPVLPAIDSKTFTD